MLTTSSFIKSQGAFTGRIALIKFEQYENTHSSINILLVPQT
jgi:hypothetical protein